MKRAFSLNKTVKKPETDLRLDLISLKTEESSILDGATGKVKYQKLKYNLNELFDNTPVFEIP
jgi:hypothetical protein